MLYNEHSDVKVTIITVVYNAVDKIEATVLSVLGQEYSNTEYIVVDGGSTDGTIDVINRYRDRIDVVISEKDNGIYDALNKGVLKAAGDWIGIMNAGDVFADENVLSKVFRNDRNLEGVDVIYGDAVSVDGSVEVLCKASENIDDLKKGPCYRHGASFVKRNVHLRYMFNLSKSRQLEFALDYEQIFRMYKGGCRFTKVNLPVIKHEMRGASTVSPFKCTYYNYLITHDMKCGILRRLLLCVVTILQGMKIVFDRFFYKLMKTFIRERQGPFVFL